MVITVNGESVSLSDEPVYISSFLSSKGINSNTVVVELNREIILRENYETAFIKDKDILEILRFVGGG
ncbi:MAG: sulfur carrier protein ThiS [Desulfamplus sp.]|nr:sulfur carrier protein ThiS [Desulfamplus sp.]